MRRPSLWLASFAMLVVLAPVQPARSQAWPQKPVKIVVPFPPGGNADGIARIVAQRLGEVFGQQFVVENRAGASGTIAAESVARAPADGYTLFLGSPSQIAIAPAMAKVRYDPVKDFVPISAIGANPFVLIVHPGVPVDTVTEFVDYVRRQPNPPTYGTAGVGSISYLTAALFLKRAGIDMIPVTYRGGAPALTDVIAGHLPMFFANLPEALAQAKSGAVRLLAVTSEARTPQLPDVPTLSESGLPGFRSVTWNGLMAPAGTPREIVDRIAREVSRSVRDPKIAALLADNGIDPVGNSPEEFASMIAADILLWAEAVKIAGAQEK